MSDLISREYMKSLGATCIASRSKDGTLFPIVAIDELPPADPTHETPSNTLGALDCVDRQAAIDALNKRARDNFTLADGYQWYLGALHDVADDIRQLPSVQPQKWIPVSERLPKRDEVVLVTYKTTGKIHLCKYLDDTSENAWWSYIDDCYAWNNVVLAWMPLPEPYKEKEE